MCWRCCDTICHAAAFANWRTTVVFPTWRAPFMSSALFAMVFFHASNLLIILRLSIAITTFFQSLYGLLTTFFQLFGRQLATFFQQHDAAAAQEPVFWCRGAARITLNSPYNEKKYFNSQGYSKLMQSGKTPKHKKGCNGQRGGVIVFHACFYVNNSSCSHV